MSEAIVLTNNQAAGVGELITLAERGREDFLYQAGLGHHTDDERTDATKRWEAAQAAANALHQQVRARPPTRPLPSR